MKRIIKSIENNTATYLTMVGGQFQKCTCNVSEVTAEEMTNYTERIRDEKAFKNYNPHA